LEQSGTGYPWATLVRAVILLVLARTGAQVLLQSGGPDEDENGQTGELEDPQTPVVVEEGDIGVGIKDRDKSGFEKTEKSS